MFLNLFSVKGWDIAFPLSNNCENLSFPNLAGCILDGFCREIRISVSSEQGLGLKLDQTIFCLKIRGTKMFHPMELEI